MCTLTRKPLYCSDLTWACVCASYRKVTNFVDVKGGGEISVMSQLKIPGHAGEEEGVYHVCFLQIDLRDDPKTLARLLYMKEKPLTYEHGVKLAKAVGSGLSLILRARREESGVCFGRHELRRFLRLKCTVFRTSSQLPVLLFGWRSCQPALSVFH